MMYPLFHLSSQWPHTGYKVFLMIFPQLWWETPDTDIGQVQIIIPRYEELVAGCRVRAGMLREWEIVLISQQWASPNLRAANWVKTFRQGQVSPGPGWSREKSWDNKDEAILSDGMIGSLSLVHLIFICLHCDQTWQHLRSVSSQLMPQSRIPSVWTLAMQSAERL